jgi:hypothetical protein
MQRGCQLGVASKCERCGGISLVDGEHWRCIACQADDAAAHAALNIVRVASGAAAGESTLARVEWLAADLAATRAALADECKCRGAAEARVAELEAKYSRLAREMPTLAESVETLPPHRPPTGSDPTFDGTFPAPEGGRSAGRVTQGEGA